MIINRSENVSMLKDAFYKVFSSNNPFSEMFMPSIKHKFLLYPTGGMHRLTKKQYSSLIRAIEVLGETSFYLSDIEGQAFEIDDNSHYWELSTKTRYREYSELPIYLDNAFYSLSGKWGAIVSHEDHVVFGGPEEFIDTFRRIYPGWKDHQKKFVEYFEYYNKGFPAENLSWIPGYLKYINE